MDYEVEPIKTLTDTTDLMTSSDYKARFLAEYAQTKLRYEKLKAFNNRIEAAEGYGIGEAPKHDCPLELLKDQQYHMGNYLHCLELRAVMEHVDISNIG